MARPAVLRLLVSPLANSSTVASQPATNILAIVLTLAIAVLMTAPAHAAPSRIVSLDYCADQYVLGLVPRERILAVSRDAHADYSYFRDRVGDLRTTSGRAESVIALGPDLIVRSYGGGPRASAYFAALGIPVLDVPYAQSIEETRAALAEMSRGLGVADIGEYVWNASAPPTRPAAPATGNERHTDVPFTALYLTPGGATAGKGTFIDSLFAAAGLQSYEQRPGWHALPLERLARAEPTIAVTAFTRGVYAVPDRWSPARHPLARRHWQRDDRIDLDAALTACPAWFSRKAIGQLMNEYAL